MLLALRTGEIIALPRASKREVADQILDEILKLRLALHVTRWTLTTSAAIWSFIRIWAFERCIGSRP